MNLFILKKNNFNLLGSNLFSHLYQLKKTYLSMNNLTFIHPNTFTGLNNLRFIYMYGNQIPCNCSFLRMVNNPNHGQVLADCFLQQQPSVMISATERNLISLWSNWTETITCTTSTYHRVRLCPDCSKKRYHTHCSHHTGTANSTCVMVDARSGYTPRFSSKIVKYNVRLRST